jgi:putative inorganic carbon (HCO3(-)) transporter
MRDLVLTLFVLGSVPMMVYRPFIGLLFWMWIGFMNPHRLTWGFAYSFPFVQISAIATILGWFVSKEPKRIPINVATVLWLTFTVWVTLTTVFALNPDEAWFEWQRFIKIQIMVYVMLALLINRERINQSVIVIAASICFYGVKGGLFTLATGGQHMVLGPRNSFIGGNTEIAFAIVVTLPLLWYLRGIAERRWIRMALAGVFGLCLLSVIGSYSRGAILATTAMLGFLWMRSRGKIVTGIVGMIALVVGLELMPDKWFDRMSTIGGELDRSEQGRINAWWFAYHLAADRPLMGGGFGAFNPDLFLRYAPDPEFFRDAHSIFFEILGEQGYVGLLLYLCMGLAIIIAGWKIERRTRGLPELQWASQLARMCQVSLVGYVVGGLFLGLAYFDLPYAVAALILATGEVVRRHPLVVSAAPKASRPGAYPRGGLAEVVRPDGGIP